MITATFTHLTDLSDGDLRLLVALVERLRAGDAATHPVTAAFAAACWAALDAEKQRRWDVLLARSQQQAPPPRLQPERRPWGHQSPAA